MRIGYDAKRAFFNNRGLGNYSRTLIRDLAQYFPEDAQILYSAKTPGSERDAWLSQLGNAAIRQPESFLAKKFPALWRSFGIATQASQDALNVFHGLSHELPRGIHKRTAIKSVVTVHDLLFMKFPEYHKWLDRQFYAQKLRYACDVADCIVAVSKHTRDDLVALMGVDPERVQVIYQSCDSVYFEPVESFEQPPNSLSLPERFILYVGALTASKNLEVLIKAFAHLGPQLDISLVLAGTGSHSESLKGLAGKLGIGDKVVMPGYVPNGELPALYSNAELFVYPSLYEGFGIPIIEAMCMQTPVLASSGSCFGESGGDAARLVNTSSEDELHAALLDILEHADTRQEMVRKGLLHVQQFHPSVTAKAMHEVYRQLCA